MDTPLHSDVAWLLTLRAAERARFLALVAHELTVWGRPIAFPEGTPFEMRLRLERLRQLNEIQHRVCSYIGYALGPDEDVRFLPIVARCVLEPRDPYLRESTTRAWTSTRKSFVAVP
jgi:hypothetical protein